MTAERTPTQSLAAAARALLRAREDQTLTRVQWEALAEALRLVDAEDSGTYEGVLETWTVVAAVVAKRALDKEGAVYAECRQGRRTAFNVSEITARQYGRVIDALVEAAEPGVDWNFGLN